MNSNDQKGLFGTIVFHGLLFLCVFLMSFAGTGTKEGNGTGEALGGIEVSLGEPDLGGPDDEAGYNPEEAAVAPSEPQQDETTLTEDDANAPVMESKEKVEKPKSPVVASPKITPPVFKPTKPNPNPVRMPDSKGLFKKGGFKGDGKTPGNEGRPDGSVFGDKDGNGGDGTGGPGGGDGNGDGLPGDGGPGGGTVKFDLSGFKRDREFNIETNRAGSGSVFIELCVYKDGRLKSARPMLGGTMTDKYFIDLALKAVKENTYSPIGSITSDKCGKVKFTFKTR